MKVIALSLGILLASSELAPRARAEADPHGHSAVQGPSAAEALIDLKAGNARFAAGEPAHSQQGTARRKELVSGQKPGAIVLSCSDSRVPPELVFDKGLGEVFVIRVAGNILGAAQVASVEYALEHLGSRLIVVMGHESCGAVKAAVTTPVGTSAGSHDLDFLVSDIQHGLDGDLAHDASDKKLRKPVMKNVDAVARRLVQRSRIVRKLVEAGEVQVVSAIYSLETGKVDFWNDGAPRKPERASSNPGDRPAH